MTSVSSIRRGEPIDILVEVDSPRPVATIELRVAYDPAVLRLRVAEEVDHSADAYAGPRARFRTAIAAEDGATFVIANSPPVAGRSTMALAQFEAIQPGAASIDVIGINLVDETGRAIRSATAAMRIPIEVQ